MGSRRTTSQSDFGNGRSSGGNAVRRSRSAGCSYLSSVRPANRSTLCSVMAQLTEETQPSFVTTLRPRAVSENCNVKFCCVVTGYPAPQVTWYKDDKQLDRFCGLPKYEILQNGQNYSLQIYNCTVEDAAIYQASAINSKGIVSCSGVLEVGEMNEFKIHQRYFAKLQQKAENRCREAQGKENQALLRTMSPDRTQRKRRSTMEAFVGTKSSTEDEGSEDTRQAEQTATESRLQEATAKETDGSSIPDTKKSEMTSRESNSQNRTYVYDSDRRTVAVHPPKAPSIKKKMKIFNDGKVMKTDKSRSSFSSPPACAETEISRESEEDMEVDNILSSLEAREEELKTAPTQEVVLVGDPLEDKDIFTDKSLTSNVSLNQTVPAREGNGSKEDAGHKHTEEHPEMENQVPDITLMQNELNNTWKHQNTSIKEEHKVEETETAEINPAEDTNTQVFAKINGHKSIKYMYDSDPKIYVTHQRQNPAVENIMTFSLSPKMVKTDTSIVKIRDDMSSSSGPSDFNDTTMINEKSEGNMQMGKTHSSLEVLKEKATKSGTKDPCLFLKPKLETSEEDDKDTEEQPKTQIPILQISSAKKQLNIKETGQMKTLVTDVKLSSVSEGSSVHGCSRSADTPRDRRSPRELSASLQPGEETGPCQKEEPLSGAAVPSEVAQDPAEVNKNDAPVDLKLPPDRLSISSLPPLKKDELPTTPLFSGLHENTDKIKQGAFHDSWKSGERGTAIFTHKQKSQLEIPGGKKSLQEYTLFPTTHQSRVETADWVIQEVTMANVGELGNSLEQIKSEKMLEMDVYTVQSKTEEIEEEKIEGSPLMTVDASEVENSTNEPAPETKENTRSELCHLNPETPVKAPSIQLQTTENTSGVKLFTDFEEISPPEPKVISIAELLRSQIKALELENTVLNITATNDVRKLYPKVTDPKPDTNISVQPLEPTKETLRNVEGEIHRAEEEQLELPNKSLPVTQALSECLEILPVMSKRTETTDMSVPDGRIETKTIEIASKTAVLFKDASVCKSSAGRPPEAPETILEGAASSFTAASFATSVQQAFSECSETSKNQTSLEHTLEREIKANNEMGKGVTHIIQNKMEKHCTGSLQGKQSYESGKEFRTNTNRLIDNKDSRFDCTNNPLLDSHPLSKNINCSSPATSASPRELANGARRKVLSPKDKSRVGEETALPADTQTQWRDRPDWSAKPGAGASSPGLSQRTPKPEPDNNPKRHSPILNRRLLADESKATTQPHTEEVRSEGQPAEKIRHNPYKAPQVIRKIRGEAFADGSGHLKLWCQFFNVLSDSTVKWNKNDEEISQLKKKAGDETPIHLAIVQAFAKDAGVYGCSIMNEHGSDSTDFLLSAEILAGMSLREDLGVGEEIEMTPLIFSKGLADSGIWGNKFFGRIMVTESHIGDGCCHKGWRAKVIYGLDPVFESGDMCIIKVRSPIVYEGKEENCLTERNLDAAKQECKIQNLAREYCKIFSAETRVKANFGAALEVIPVYLMYRPANSIPYATVESDLGGAYSKYSVLDQSGTLDMRSGSTVEQKCCAFQHWIFQWTNGSLLLSHMEGVDTKITNIGISVNSTGYHGLTIEGNPKVFEHFVLQHKCNYFCGLLGLKSLKVVDSLNTPVKLKSSRSPLVQRRKTTSSPQTSRKAAVSPRLPRKAEDSDDKSSI